MEDPIAQMWAQPLFLYDVDAPPEKRFEVLFEGHEIEQVSPCIELYQ
jgi:hypothetical protein